MFVDLFFLSGCVCFVLGLFSRFSFKKKKKKFEILNAFSYIYSKCLGFHCDVCP